MCSAAFGSSAAYPTSIDSAASGTDGANGIANGRGVRQWTERDGQALIAARMEELFRWLKADRARK